MISSNDIVDQELTDLISVAKILRISFDSNRNGYGYDNISIHFNKKRQRDEYTRVFYANFNNNKFKINMNSIFKNFYNA